MTFPKHTESEKKTWVTALYQTSGSNSLSHCGLKKYSRPFIAPGKVIARVNKIPSTTYGKIARKYEAFPELLTPLIKSAATSDQETKRQRTNFQLGTPRPS